MDLYGIKTIRRYDGYRQTQEDDLADAEYCEMHILPGDGDRESKEDVERNSKSTVLLFIKLRSSNNKTLMVLPCGL